MSGWRYAFSLSRDEVRDATPPGTVILVEHYPGKQGRAEESDQIVKIPVPSADPADPLNWPKWRKIAILLVGSFYSFVANFLSSSIAPVLSLWYQTFPEDHRSFSHLTYFTAVNVLMLGASNIWWVPLSNAFGRRPTMLCSTLLMALCTLWCGLATSYSSLLAARFFQGVGGGAADTVPPAIVGDVFFMDQRGRAMAVYTVFLASGSLVGGIAGGYIGNQLGWAYVFWVGLALAGACFLATLFLSPETQYERKEVPAQDVEAECRIVADKPETAYLEQAQQQVSYRPYTFARSLGFGKYQGRLFYHFTRPWLTLLLPGTWVVMLHYAALVGGIVTISVMGAQLVSEPPYLWGANAGLINVGGLIGTVLAALYAYLVSDRLLLKRARHEKHGFAEPEDRLPSMIPALVLATAGFLVFGFCAQNPGPGRWVGLEVGYGMLAFGLMQVPSIGFNYLIDAYSSLAPDCFVVVNILRAVIAFAWTFFVAQWAESRGPAEPFGIFGMLMGLFGLLVVPLWLLGKRMRIATAGHFGH